MEFLNATEHLMDDTPVPGGTSTSYIYGVVLALLGSTLQALGLLLWKVHFNR